MGVVGMKKHRFSRDYLRRGSFESNSTGMVEKSSFLRSCFEACEGFVKAMEFLMAIQKY